MQLSDYTLDTQALAEKLGYHQQYVRTLAAQKKLPAIKRGREWRFCEAEILRHLQMQTQKTLGAGENGQTDQKNESDSVSEMLR